MSSQKAEEILARIRRIPTPYCVSLAGIEIQVQRDVYPTGELSEVVIECLERPGIGLAGGEKVLDYGTGTGFLAIAAANRGASRVLAIDVNPSAVRCAGCNVEHHGLQDVVEVRHSDGFAAIRDDEMFDVILAGMPFEASPVTDVLQRSVYDPDFSMRRSLFNNALTHLNPGGRIFTSYSQRVQSFQPLEKFDDRYTYEIAAQRVIKGELDFVFLLRPRRPCAQ